MGKEKEIIAGYEWLGGDEQEFERRNRKARRIKRAFNSRKNNRRI